MPVSQSQLNLEKNCKDGGGVGMDVREMRKGNIRVGEGDCKREHEGGMGGGEIGKGSMGEMVERSRGRGGMGRGT